MIDTAGQSTATRSGEDGARTAPPPPPPLPAAIAGHLVDEVRSVAAATLTEDEAESITVELATDERGHFLSVRGESEVVDRLERASTPTAIRTGRRRSLRPPTWPRGDGACGRRRSATAAARRIVRRRSASRPAASQRCASDGTGSSTM